MQLDGGLKSERHADKRTQTWAPPHFAADAWRIYSGRTARANRGEGRNKPINGALYGPRGTQTVWVAGKAVPLSALPSVCECDANKFYCLLRVLFVARGFLRSGHNLCRDFGANLLALPADHTHGIWRRAFLANFAHETQEALGKLQQRKADNEQTANFIFCTFCSRKISNKKWYKLQLVYIFTIVTRLC